MLPTPTLFRHIPACSRRESTPAPRISMRAASANGSRCGSDTSVTLAVLLSSKENSLVFDAPDATTAENATRYTLKYAILPLVARDEMKFRIESRAFLRIPNSNFDGNFLIKKKIAFRFARQTCVQLGPLPQQLWSSVSRFAGVEAFPFL
ncbi:hypothetical protein EVAR_98803_1 [Eumeta japonica]|uniref:Uncharacterized protein n=1 Tax=Eumeta variegata TaxID=151549 RepID=A0A4C1XX51_EUMVA|nr:hypothetical protein EVAR_98803_1 [Eumeta japonica]